MQKIAIGEKYLTLSDFEEVLYQSSKVSLNESALAKVERSFRYLLDFTKDKIVYGVNTGFGPMAPYIISKENNEALQYNLIRSHSSGTGDLLPDTCIKATVMARLNSLIQGYSGIHPEVIELLTELLNHDIYPCIYAHGGVGASGDLVQLAHLALTMIGEGNVRYKGEIQPTASVFKALGLKPIQMHQREGLALLNGTSTMTGIGIVNLIKAKQLLQLALLASAMINEIVEAYDDHFSAELNNAKMHKGQKEVAKEMRNLLEGSKLIKKRYSYLHQSKLNGVNKVKDRVQEYYSLRCISQVLGPVADTIAHAEKILMDEANSANDNPIIDVENDNIFHGGNFHGDYVSLEMDKVKIAITKLSMLCERQLNFLMNDKLNNKLPPFLNRGTLGLNFGLQGVQFTATSTVAENQTLSNPMYVHSIPNNNDNQDIVSMGANAAMMTHKVINNTFEVISIEFMAILQAIDILKIVPNLAPATKAAYLDMRTIVATFEKDHTHYQDIQQLTKFLKNKAITSKAIVQ